jgi:hypothetical protein
MNQALIGFAMQNRRIRFVLTLPPRSDFTKTGTGKERKSIAAIDQAHEQACRSLWRSLALVIKAKLEAIETGIATFDEEFMAHIVLPDGKTVGEHMTSQIEHVYQTGKMPPFLSGMRALPGRGDAKA